MIDDDPGLLEDEPGSVDDKPGMINDPGQNDDEDQDESYAHGLAKHPDGSVTCLKCGIRIRHLSNAYRHFKTFHMKVQVELKDLKCSVCGRVWKTKASRYAHMYYKHGINSEKSKRTVPKS